MTNYAEQADHRDNVMMLMKNVPMYYSVHEKNAEYLQMSIVLQATTNVLLAAILDELQKGKK